MSRVRSWHRPDIASLREHTQSLEHHRPALAPGRTPGAALRRCGGPGTRGWSGPERRPHGLRTASGDAPPLSEATTDRQRAEAFDGGGAEDWDQWWGALAEEPAVADLQAERSRCFTDVLPDDLAPIFDVHEAAMRNAGFREVGVIWQRLDNRVLLGVR